jgi:membrane fusion protein, adhesin transport system
MPIQNLLPDNKCEQMITVPKTARKLSKFILGTFLFFIFMLFMPWTQNIRTEGKVTTLTPYDRPQGIQSIIDGRIERWYVKEGDLVKAGDTIIYISEIKDQYFDPKLLERTRSQITAKQGAINSYEEKMRLLSSQVGTEKINLQNKLSQARNRVIQSRNTVRQDSAELKAAIVNYKIAKEQLDRGEKLFKDGLISLTALEQRRAKEQDASAKEIVASQKLSNSLNSNFNAIIELNAIEAEFLSKIYKIESDIQSTNSDMFKADEELAKLNNQYSNYAIRNGNYFLLAPKSGQIVKIRKAGIGETIKQGEEIASITSTKPNLAVELYVKPVDLPLIQKGNKVRIIFDGWPTIVFSGWPGVSHGTFGAVVQVIDSDISDNGKYRILVGPDPKEDEWPNQIQLGGGARGIALLKNVQIGYEMWRNLNGFPPDFYIYENEKAKSKK